MVSAPLLSRRARIALILGGWCQAWWCLAALLLSFGALGAPRTHLDFVTFTAPTATTLGRVLQVIEHERSGRYGSWSEYEHRFAFEVDGNAVHATSWSTHPATDGAEVAVEYVLATPGLARIVGMTTAPNQPWVILLGLFLCFAAFAWTLWRVSDVELRAARIRDRLASARPYASYGFLPKVRLDRDGQIVTWSPATLLVCPAVALAALTLLMFVM